MNSIIEQLNWRYATKAFDPTKKITTEQLHTIKEALRLTPSSFGLQPWYFLFVSDNQLRTQLKAVSWNQSQVVDCSHHVVICRKAEMTNAYIDEYIASTAASRSMNVSDLQSYAQMMKGFLSSKTEAQIAHWMEKQCYIALGQLMTVCAQMKIDACPMEGFDPDQYNEILQLPSKGLRVVVTCPIGFRADSDKYAKLAKVRWPMQSVVSEI